jgi:hypothetical protein
LNRKAQERDLAGSAHNGVPRWRGSRRRDVLRTLAVAIQSIRNERPIEDFPDARPIRAAERPSGFHRGIWEVAPRALPVSLAAIRDATLQEDGALGPGPGGCASKATEDQLVIGSPAHPASVPRSTQADLNRGAPVADQ